MAEPRQHVVVTGAGGFLGRHLVRHSLERGYAVTGTFRTPVRAKQARQALEAAGCAGAASLRSAIADLDADAGWAEALKGASILIHAASPFPAKAPDDPMELIRPAVEGTRRVLQAAAASGVRRVLVTSSVAAVMYGEGKPPYDETHWTDPDGALATAYYASKTLAEREAWALARDLGLDLTVLCPGMILGPMIGKTPATSVGLVRNLINGRYPAMPKFTVPIVDVRDVAQAHLRAIETTGARGERFILAGQSLSIADIVALIRAQAPDQAAKLPGMTVPNWTARAAAAMHPGLALIVRELGRDNRVTAEKARAVLGWQARAEAEVLRDTVRSLVAEGLVA